MLYHPHLKDEWLVSPAAKKFYSVCALVALFCWLGVLIAAITALTVAGEVTIRSSPVSAVVQVLLFVGVLAAATIWVAMWYFWFRFGIDGRAGGALWFLVMFTLGPIGTLLYFALVYRKAQIPFVHKKPIPA